MLTSMKLRSYLTVDAQILFDELCQLGLDPDLALEIIEKAETDIWELDA